MKTELTETDYELISRYLDGELGADEVDALRARLQSEPPLRQLYERLAALDNRLRAAFHIPGADMVPGHITQLVASARTREQGVPPRRSVGWGLGVAASVLVAAGVLLNLDRQDQGGAQFAAQDALVAPVLERALSRAEGWDVLPDGSRVRALLSFPDQDGGWCREYLLAQEESAWRGVACRSSGQWQTAVLAEEGAAATGPAYRPAAGMSPEQVVSFIDQRSADIPLSREQEAALIDRGWN